MKNTPITIERLKERGFAFFDDGDYYCYYLNGTNATVNIHFGPAGFTGVSIDQRRRGLDIEFVSTEAIWNDDAPLPTDITMEDVMVLVKVFSGRAVS